MSESLGSPTSSAVTHKVSPDFFSFYTSEVRELLSRDEGLLPLQLSSKSGVNVPNGSPPFSNGIGALVSEFEKERLKSLLRQSVFTLTKEVDEMIDPILSICRIRACLRCKECHVEVDKPHQPLKRLKRGCSNQLKNGPIMKPDAKDDKEIDEDLRFLLESDTTKVEELVKNHSNGFSATLNHMEQKLEELLNILMTTCRPMTLAEKQQLRKSIQNLPPKNLDRVVEIIGHDKNYSCSEVHVDLEGMDNVTLWRLHFYITTTQKKPEM